MVLSIACIMRDERITATTVLFFFLYTRDNSVHSNAGRGVRAYTYNIPVVPLLVYTSIGVLFLFFVYTIAYLYTYYIIHPEPHARRRRVQYIKDVRISIIHTSGRMIYVRTDAHAKTDVYFMRRHGGRVHPRVKRAAVLCIGNRSKQIVIIDLTSSGGGAWTGTRTEECGKIAYVYVYSCTVNS